MRDGCRDGCRASEATFVCECASCARRKSGTCRMSAEAVHTENRRQLSGRLDRERRRRAKLDAVTVDENVARQMDVLKNRVATLEMAAVEADALRAQVAALEWALDAVRADADRVRDDALAVLSDVEVRCGRDDCCCHDRAASALVGNNAPAVAWRHDPLAQRAPQDIRLSPPNSVADQTPDAPPSTLRQCCAT